MTEPARKRRGALDFIERVGNVFPDPIYLFMLGTLIVMALSALGAWLGWSVEEMRPVAADDGSIRLEATGRAISTVSLLSADSVYWFISTMVQNFIAFPPLGIVLVGMLGVGVAERTGLIAASLKSLMLVAPAKMLTPMLVFLGVLSSVGSDAGYIVLPPIAAALYRAMGRSPLAGIAAVFAGVSGGFSANLLVSGGDAIIAGLTTSAGRLIDPDHETIPTANWWFMIASTFMLTFVGWAVSVWIVEPRLARRPVEDGGAGSGEAAPELTGALSATEKKGLVAAIVGVSVVTGLLLAAGLIPGGPLHGVVPGARPGAPATPRWVAAIVPGVMIVFLAPGFAYGWATGAVRSLRQAAAVMVDSMRAMAPIIVLAFFAAQFVACFNYSQLGRMLAVAGGESLAQAGLPIPILIVCVVILTAIFNLFVGSMSAKWAMLAPILVPMLMMLGVSPALTQMAYRVGDSVTNIISPMNTYLVVILAAMQRYAPRAGLGTLAAAMFPYSVAFFLFWSALLVVWIGADYPLGPGGGLRYVPSAP